MAKCKICKTEIPDGTEYCNTCLDKENAKTNESYLDSLLNSVKNTTPSVETIYKKKSEANVEVAENTPESVPDTNLQDEDMYQFDIGDIEDFDQFDFEDDISDLSTEDIISDEDLFGVQISDGLPTTDPVIEPLDITTDNTENDELDDDNSEYDNLLQEMNSASDYDDNEEEFTSDLNNLLNQLDQEPDEPEYSEGTMETPIENNVPLDNELLLENETPIDNEMQFENEISFNNEIEPDIDSLAYHEKEQEQSFGFMDDPSLADEEDEEENEDDFLSLLNQISSDDPVSDDVKAINDLMNGVPSTDFNETSMPSDVGEVFSDALKAVSNLNDPNLDENDLLNSVIDKSDKKTKKEKNKKTKKAKKEKSTGDNENKPKKSLWIRLFGNVEDKKASKKGAPVEGTGDLAASEIIEVPQKTKGKKSKKGKDKEAKDGDSKEKSANADQENPEDTKGKKKEKKPKKLKSNDVIQVIDEIDEDVGRINRLGATIVFVFFALLALLIYAGSNAVSYTLSIQHATSYFNNQKYTQAYDEVYGINIEDDDKEIYSKIMTVMFVNKQLNSYNNYCTIGEYPQALDSLLKGLKRYDKYIQLATMLGIKNDMDYVRKQILAELKSEFKLSEANALNIISINNMKEYSLKVYDVALQNE